MLKSKCQKALDILKVVSSADWGADFNILLNLYRSLVRSKLDYGSIVYGSAKKSYLQILDPVHHQGLRLCLGAFRTSPVESLYAEANEPSLADRRLKLSLQYAAKLKAFPTNPAYDCVFNPIYTKVFQKHETKIPPFGIRIKPHLEKIDFNFDQIFPVQIPKSPPWELPRPKFIFDLRKHKKSDTNPLIIQQHFAEIKSKYTDYSTAYTDGSKDGDKVAAAATLDDESATLRLPAQSSIFSAEARAIVLALELIAKSSNSKFIICSDSLSCLLAIQNHKIKNPLIYRILHSLFRLKEHQKEVIFFWIPSHVGIRGNTVVDRIAKEAIDGPELNCYVPHPELGPCIRNYCFKLWSDRWRKLENNKLLEVKPQLGAPQVNVGNRREQVVITRCRIGHSRTTHGHLL